MKKLSFPLLLLFLMLNACTPMDKLVLNGVSLDETELSLPYGETFTLQAKVTPSRVAGKVSFVWSTNNPAIADVDENGTVTANDYGEAVITVTASQDEINFTATCTVTVVAFELDEQYIPDEIFRNYCLQNFDTNGDGILFSNEIMNVQDIDVSNLGVESLEGIQYFKSLKTLYCDDNQLTTLDVSNNTSLQILFCGRNQLTTLDISNNTALQIIFSSGNQLTTLDVGNNSALESLAFSDNQLTTLDISTNTVLRALSCWNNQLTTLDVSNNTSLQHLECGGNQLTTLDVSNNTVLRTLYCYNNQLTTLDVSNKTNLLILQCNNNQLTTLDVSNNTSLEALICHHNQLTTLDVSDNTALNWLHCNHNPNLTELWLKTGQVFTNLEKDDHTEIKYKD